MTTIAIVWWLVIHMGGSNSPVFVPAPYASEAACVAAGTAFKASEMDRFEAGRFACLPGEKPNDEGEGK